MQDRNCFFNGLISTPGSSEMYCQNQAVVNQGQGAYYAQIQTSFVQQSTTNQQLRHTYQQYQAQPVSGAQFRQNLNQPTPLVRRNVPSRQGSGIDFASRTPSNSGANTSCGQDSTLGAANPVGAFSSSAMSVPYSTSSISCATLNSHGLGMTTATNYAPQLQQPLKSRSTSMPNVQIPQYSTLGGASTLGSMNQGQSGMPLKGTLALSSTTAAMSSSSYRQHPPPCIVPPPIPSASSSSSTISSSSVLLRQQKQSQRLRPTLSGSSAVHTLIAQPSTVQQQQQNNNLIMNNNNNQNNNSNVTNLNSTLVSPQTIGSAFSTCQSPTAVTPTGLISHHLFAPSSIQHLGSSPLSAANFQQQQQPQTLAGAIAHAPLRRMLSFSNSMNGMNSNNNNNFTSSSDATSSCNSNTTATNHSNVINTNIQNQMIQQQQQLCSVVEQQYQTFPHHQPHHTIPNVVNAHIQHQNTIISAPNDYSNTKNQPIYDAQTASHAHQHHNHHHHTHNNHNQTTLHHQHSHHNQHQVANDNSSSNNHVTSLPFVARRTPTHEEEEEVGCLCHQNGHHSPILHPQSQEQQRLQATPGPILSFISAAARGLSIDGLSSFSPRSSNAPSATQSGVASPARKSPLMQGGVSPTGVSTSMFQHVAASTPRSRQQPSMGLSAMLHGVVKEMEEQSRQKQLHVQQQQLQQQQLSLPSKSLCVNPGLSILTGAISTSSTTCMSNSLPPSHPASTPFESPTGAAAAGFIAMNHSQLSTNKNAFVHNNSNKLIQGMVLNTQPQTHNINQPLHTCMTSQTTSTAATTCCQMMNTSGSVGDSLIIMASGGMSQQTHIPPFPVTTTTTMCNNQHSCETMTINALSNNSNVSFSMTSVATTAATITGVDSNHMATISSIVCASPQSSSLIPAPGQNSPFADTSSSLTVDSQGSPIKKTNFNSGSGHVVGSPAVDAVLSCDTNKNNASSPFSTTTLTDSSKSTLPNNKCLSATENDLGIYSLTTNNELNDLNIKNIKDAQHGNATNGVSLSNNSSSGNNHVDYSDSEMDRDFMNLLTSFNSSSTTTVSSSTTANITPLPLQKALRDSTDVLLQNNSSSCNNPMYASYSTLMNATTCAPSSQRLSLLSSPQSPAQFLFNNTQSNNNATSSSNNCNALRSIKHEDEGILETNEIYVSNSTRKDEMYETGDAEDLATFAAADVAANVLMRPSVCNPADSKSTSPGLAVDAGGVKRARRVSTLSPEHLQSEQQQGEFDRQSTVGTMSRRPRRAAAAIAMGEV